MKILVSLLFLGSLAAVGLPSAKADIGNWDTYMKFSAPVEIPGMVLAPGRYEFRLVEPGKRDDYVAIFNAKGDLMELLFAEPEYRLTTTDKTVVTLEETSPGSPEAIQTWFYPDSNYGVRFVYPKETKANTAKSRE
jgi:hypothetical protein